MGIIEILYFLVGLFASVFGALAGLGGGIIIKPILDALGDYDVGSIGILSAATVLSMACISLIKIRKDGSQIQMNISLLLAGGSIVGGIIGKALFTSLVSNMTKANLVTSLQAGILASLILAIYLFTINKHRLKTFSIKNRPFIFLIGFVLGTLAAFLGIGGGPLNMAVLLFAFSMEAKEAAVNSIFIIFFSQTSSLLMTAFTTGFHIFDLSMLVYMVVGGGLGGFVGSAFSKKLGNQQVESIYRKALLAILCLNIYNLIVYL